MKSSVSIVAALGLAGWCGAASPAHGHTIIEFLSVDNSPGGVALEDYQTFDINLISSGQLWTGSQLRIDLYAGSFFRSSLGAINGSAPNPALFPLAPDLEFDTYLAGGDPTPLGAIDAGGDANATIPSNGDTLLDEYWFATPGSPTDLSRLQTARITFSDDAAGTLSYLASVDGAMYRYEYIGEFTPLLGLGDIDLGQKSGDYNVDGRVSQADLDLVLLNWGDGDVPSDWLATEQFDGDQISQDELDKVLLNWGASVPPPDPPQPDPFALGGGDYNADGVVSITDLDAVLLTWGETVLPAGLEQGPLGAGAFDGLMSQNEVDGVLLNWGNGISGIPIPEPATLGVFASGLVVGLRRVRTPRA